MSMFYELMMRKKEEIMYATIKGTLTENDGVFSGFSASNYLAIQEPFALTPTTKAEFVFRVSNTTFDGSSSFFGMIGSYSINFRFNTAKRLALYLGNGSSWVVNGLEGTTVFQENNFYYAKLVFDNGVITIYSSTGGKIWTQEATITVSFTYTYNLLIGRANNDASYQKGSIDLPNSYIKLGSTKYKLQAVVGYTVVGSPTITDGVASGFSADNWLRITSSIPDNRIEDYNFYTKFTISSTSRQSVIGYYGSSHNLGIIANSGKIIFVIGRTSSNTEPTITSSATYNIGDTVYVNAYYLGNNIFVLKTSLDEINWSVNTLEIDITTINNIQTNYPFRIGRAVLNNYAWVFEGSIYINNTYIKINNKLWFNGQQA